MRRIFAALAFLTLVACQTPAYRNQSAALPQRCTNTTHGFSVSYPDGWQTNDGSVMPACSVFHPSAIDLPPASEIPFELAVVIGVETMPFERNPASSQWERVLSVERLTVNGAEARRVEVESTGEGLAERGMRSLRYTVDLGGGRVLSASTHDANPSYEEHKKILARMMDTIVVEPAFTQ